MFRCHGRPWHLGPSATVLITNGLHQTASKLHLDQPSPPIDPLFRHPTHTRGRGQGSAACSGSGRARALGTRSTRALPRVASRAFASATHHQPRADADAPARPAMCHTACAPRGPPSSRVCVEPFILMHPPLAARLCRSARIAPCCLCGMRMIPSTPVVSSATRADLRREAPRRSPRHPRHCRHLHLPRRHRRGHHRSHRRAPPSPAPPRPRRDRWPAPP